MSVKSDIEIAQAAEVRPITEIASKLDIPQESLIPYGHDKAKINADFIKSLADKGRVIRIPIHMLNTIKKCYFVAKHLTQELGRDPTSISNNVRPSA